MRALHRPSRRRCVHVDVTYPELHHSTSTYIGESMSDKTPTVIALKSSFLRTQTRILSQPLQPSQQWRDNSRERGTLSENAVREAIRECTFLLLLSKKPYADIYDYQ